MQNEAFSLTLNRLISCTQKDFHCDLPFVPSQSEDLGLKQADSYRSEKYQQTGAQRTGLLASLRLSTLRSNLCESSFNETEAIFCVCVPVKQSIGVANPSGRKTNHSYVCRTPIIQANILGYFPAWFH